MSTSAFHITPEELFDALCVLAAALPADSEAIVPTTVNRELHELLVQTCHEGIRDSQQAFGNLFAQVDYLCRTKHVAVPDRIAIQTLRRHSNRNEPLTAGDLRYDLRALALFISAVFGVSVPSRVVDVIPPTNRPHERAEAIDYRYLRCIVRSWDKQIINAVDERTDTPIRIDYTAEHLAYIGNIIHEGTQINLLDCTNIDGLLVPDLIVVEPDFMVDISSVAASFESFGHHPLNYTVRRMAPSTISQAILLGHLAGTVLDDTIHQRTASVKSSGRKRSTSAFVLASMLKPSKPMLSDRLTISAMPSVYSIRNRPRTPSSNRLLSAKVSDCRGAWT